MTATLNHAAEAHHAELQTGLTQLTETLLTSVANRAPHQPAQRELVDFLRGQLLPHAEVEQTLLYAAGTHQTQTSLLVRAMTDEHRMMVALIDEVDQAATAIDAAVAAGAVVVLCDVRIEQENRLLLPALAEAGVDITTLLNETPEIIGDTPRAAVNAATSTDHRGMHADDSTAIGQIPRQLQSIQGDERGSDSQVDLSGLDYHERRRRLFTALRALQPGQVLRLNSDQADDVYWLRYEAEVRMSQRYYWSLPSGMPGAVETIVRCPDRLL